MKRLLVVGWWEYKENEVQRKSYQLDWCGATMILTKVAMELINCPNHNFVVLSQNLKEL